MAEHDTLYDVHARAVAAERSRIYREVVEPLVSALGSIVDEFDREPSIDGQAESITVPSSTDPGGPPTVVATRIPRGSWLMLRARIVNSRAALATAREQMGKEK